MEGLELWSSWGQGEGLKEQEGPLGLRLEQPGSGGWVRCVCVGELTFIDHLLGVRGSGLGNS